MAEEFCTFCRLVQGQNSYRYDELFGSDGSVETLATMKIGLIVPDISPLIEGHVMLISHAHIGSFSEADQDQLREVDKFLSAYRNCCFNYFGTRMIAFEHGVPLSEAGNNTCVEHAHIHIVPLPAHVRFGDIIERLNLKPETGLMTRSENRHYLAAWDDAGQLWVADKESFESQIFRREIGRELEDVLWHWEDRLIFQQKSVAQKYYARCAAAAKLILEDSSLSDF